MASESLPGHSPILVRSNPFLSASITLSKSGPVACCVSLAF